MLTCKIVCIRCVTNLLCVVSAISVAILADYANGVLSLRLLYNTGP